MNPIRKVVTLLQDMQKEITAEGEKEQDMFDHFMCYCDGNTKGMEDGAKAAAARITELKAKLEAGTAEKQQLDQELMGHKQDRAAAQQDLKNAQAIRDKERQEYEAAVGEQKQNLEAMTAAIAAISKGSAQSLVQTEQSRISNAVKAAKSLDPLEKNTVLAFLSAAAGQNPFGDYQSQSGEVVGILKNMKDSMDEELNGAVSEEEKAVSGFQALASAKKAEIAAASEAIEAKTERSGALAVENANCADEIEDTTQELSDTQAFLANLSVQCAEKKKEWDERQASRAQEILAISEAIKVLNDDDALDVFKKSLGFTQETPKAFLQKGRTPEEVTSKAKALLAKAQDKATKAQKQRLALIAYALQAKAVDFGKVIKMIDDMVETLKQEQVDDDAQKSFCEQDLAESENRKKDVQDELAASQALLAETQENSAAAAAEIESLKKEIEGLDKAVAEATSQRIKEHEDFVQFSSESNLAVQLIAKAKGKLEAFYRPKEAFVQLRSVHRHGHRQAPEAPPTWSGDYQAKEGKSNGVFALLDNLAGKLKGELAEAERDEATAQKEYEGLMTSSTASRQQNVESITDLEAAKADLDTKAERTKEAESAHTVELANVEEYLTKLHASCDFLTTNYDLRKAARENEVEALKNAKAVLAGADFA